MLRRTVSAGCVALVQGSDLFLANHDNQAVEDGHADIEKVFIVFSNHLDVGYTDYAMEGSPGLSKQPVHCASGSLWVGEVSGTSVWRQHIEYAVTSEKMPAVSVTILGGTTDGSSINPGGPCCGDKFAVSSENITTTGFEMRLERLGVAADAGWAQLLFIGWTTDEATCPYPPLPELPRPLYPGIPVLMHYWYDFVTRAASTAKRLPKLAGAKAEWSYKWMSHSWVFDMLLGCKDAPDGVVPGLNHSLLTCPTEEQLEAFESAVRSGAVTWHAFPHNGEPEMYPGDYFRTAIQRTHALDQRFGKSPRRCMSQRDVPGLSRAALPLLRAEGVELVSVGANGAAGEGGRPEVPRIFLWEDVASGSEVITLLHPGGYGWIDNCAVVPEAKAALCPAWRSDNMGPHSAEEALDIFQQVQSSFPNAKVMASDAFEEFLDAVKPFKASLPKIRQELGDSWIYGASTDPVKVAGYRAALRARRTCVEAGRWNQSGHAEDAFDRLLMKVGEHTWGDNANECREVDFDNAGLQKALSDKSWGGQKCLATWWEQRSFVSNAVLQLQKFGAQCASDIADAVAVATRPPAPFDESGFAKVEDPIGQQFLVLNTTIAFGASGGLAQLERSGQHWAQENAPLAEFVYQTLDNSTMEAFIHNYSKGTGCCAKDFYKPGLPDSLNGKPTAGIAKGSLQRLLRREWEDGSSSFIAHVKMPEFEHLYRGAPASVALRVDVSGANIELTLQLRNKTTTHVPETPWFAFPAAFPAVDDSVSLLLDKMGSWVDPSDVLLSFGFWAPHLHAVDAGFRYSVKDRGLLVETLDAALVSVGAMNPTPYHPAVPQAADGTFVSLVNNIWNTNYPQWFPFTGAGDPEANLQYRFRLTLS